MSLKINFFDFEEVPDYIYEQIVESAKNNEDFNDHLLSINLSKGFLVVIMKGKKYLGGTVVELDSYQEVPAMKIILCNDPSIDIIDLILDPIIDFMRDSGYKRLWIHPYQIKTIIYLSHGFQQESFNRLYYDL